MSLAREEARRGDGPGGPVRSQRPTLNAFPHGMRTNDNRKQTLLYVPLPQSAASQ